MTLIKRSFAQQMVFGVAMLLMAAAFAMPGIVNADGSYGDYVGDFGGWDNYSYGWDNYSYGYDNYDYGWDNYSYGYDNYDYGWDNYSYGWDNYSYGADTYYDDPTYTDYYYDDPVYTDYYYDDSYYTDYYYDDYYSYDYGCGSSCYGGYSSGCSWCGGYGGSYSIPTYSIGQPARSSSSSYYNSNTNVNNITNIDNSINDSFNTYVSDSYNNTSIVVANPQTPVVSTPAPYCTINHALSSGYGYYNQNVAYLSWTSQNATSAYLSNVGTVSTSGSQNVYPSYTTTYTLTVYGVNGQSANCSTTVTVNTYTPPVYNPPVVQQPYVALTQIPYTGFDLGPIGNAMYWAGLALFAIAGAYLMVYYRGGMFAFVGNMIGARAQKAYAPVVAPKAPILVEREAAEAAKVAPVVAAMRKNGTTDSMAIIGSKDGSMPKIVIERY